MKLAVLAAGIDLGRQVAEERRVDGAAGELAAQLRPVHTGQARSEAQADEGPHQLGRIPMPDGKETPHPDLGEVTLAIGAQVREEDVPECNGADAPRPEVEHRALHQRLVLLVGTAIRRQVELVESHADRRRLLLKEFDPHAVVADALELPRDGRDERDDLVIAASP